MTSIHLLQELFKHESLVLIGSAGLEVQTEDSDIDICVLRSELSEKEIEKLGRPIAKRGTYHDSLLLIHSDLHKLDDLDIFVFDCPTHLIIIQAVIDIMKIYPKVLLRIKWIRVKMFRYLLKKHGFLLGGGYEESNRAIADFPSEGL